MGKTLRTVRRIEVRVRMLDKLVMASEATFTGRSFVEPDLSKRISGYGGIIRGHLITTLPIVNFTHLRRLCGPSSVH